jgi:hypothetical protein
MVAITAANSATPSLQSSLSKTRLQQARREADQAESTAQNLRAQADNAENDAQRSRGQARTLAASMANTDPTYQPRRAPGPSGLRPESQNLLVDLFQKTAALRGTGVNPLQASNAQNPMQNTQGQTIGRIVSLRA